MQIIVGAFKGANIVFTRGRFYCFKFIGFGVVIFFVAHGAAVVGFIAGPAI